MALKEASPLIKNGEMNEHQLPSNRLSYHSLPNPLQFGNLQILNAQTPDVAGSGKRDTNLAKSSMHGTVAHDEHQNQTKLAGINSIPKNYQAPSPMEDTSKSWANVAASTSKNGKLPLHFFKPTYNDKGIPTIKPPMAVAIEGRKQWKNCLVGTFLDKKPPFHTVQSITFRLWKKFDLTDVMLNDRGFFFFKFTSETEMEQCLEDGPWLFQNKPIHLQKWRPAMDLFKEIPKVVPLWVKLFDVPMEYWTSMGLSYIVSGIGNPLSLDKMTEETCRKGIGRI